MISPASTTLRLSTATPAMRPKATIGSKAVLDTDSNSASGVKGALADSLQRVRQGPGWIEPVPTGQSHGADVRQYHALLADRSRLPTGREDQSHDILVSVVVA